jgi:hypothetical protein
MHRCVVGDDAVVATSMKGGAVVVKGLQQTGRQTQTRESQVGVMQQAACTGVWSGMTLLLPPA